MKALSIDGNVFKFPCGKVKGNTKAFRDDQFPYQLQLMNFDVYNSIEYQWLKANNIHTFRKLVPIIRIFSVILKKPRYRRNERSLQGAVFWIHNYFDQIIDYCAKHKVEFRFE